MLHQLSAVRIGFGDGPRIDWADRQNDLWHPSDLHETTSSAYEVRDCVA